EQRVAGGFDVHRGRVVTTVVDLDLELATRAHHLVRLDRGFEVLEAVDRQHARGRPSHLRLSLGGGADDELSDTGPGLTVLRRPNVDLELGHRIGGWSRGVRGRMEQTDLSGLGFGAIGKEYLAPLRRDAFHLESEPVDVTGMVDDGDGCPNFISGVGDELRWLDLELDQLRTDGRNSLEL